MDAFYKGGETIPGFAPAGIGPRDASTGDALGGTTFYSATAELRFPLPFLPSELGLSGAVFTSAGTLFGTNAQTAAATYAKQHGVTNTLAIQDSSALRSSAGGSIVWDRRLARCAWTSRTLSARRRATRRSWSISAIPAGKRRGPALIAAKAHAFMASTKADRSSGGIARSGTMKPTSGPYQRTTAPLEMVTSSIASQAACHLLLRLEKAKPSLFICRWAVSLSLGNLRAEIRRVPIATSQR